MAIDLCKRGAGQEKLSWVLKPLIPILLSLFKIPFSAYLPSDVMPYVVFVDSQPPFGRWSVIQVCSRPLFILANLFPPRLLNSWSCSGILPAFKGSWVPSASKSSCLCLNTCRESLLPWTSPLHQRSSKSVLLKILSPISPYHTSHFWSPC